MTDNSVTIRVDGKMLDSGYGEYRLGQKLCNYIHSKGFRNEDVHIMLFHMQNSEFIKALQMDPVKLNREFDRMAHKSGKFPG